MRHLRKLQSILPPAVTIGMLEGIVAEYKSQREKTKSGYFVKFADLVTYVTSIGAYERIIVTEMNETTRSGRATTGITTGNNNRYKIVLEESLLKFVEYNDDGDDDDEEEDDNEDEDDDDDDDEEEYSPTGTTQATEEEGEYSPTGTTQATSSEEEQSESDERKR